MSMQRAQGVLLFLVRFNNSARFEIHGVTRSSSSRPFLCALGQTIVQILHHFAVTVNNIEVTVSTCTCKEEFTIITTKDQSGGTYNNYSTGGQRFMALVNKPRPRPMP